MSRKKQRSEGSRNNSLPDINSSSSAKVGTLRSKTPSSSCGDVEYPDISIYYRFKIVDVLSGNWVNEGQWGVLRPVAFRLHLTMGLALSRRLHSKQN